METKIKLGKYRHYKGFICNVVGVAKHSESQDELVIYTHIDENGENQLWARPIGMFMEDVGVENYKGPRFLYIGE